MDCQITIKRNPRDLQELFARAETRTFRDGEITLGGPDAGCPLPGYEGAPGVIRRRGGRHWFVPPEEGAGSGGFLVDGRAVTEETPLRSGDSLSWGDFLVRFYLRHDRAGVALSSRILTAVTRWGVAGVLAVQFLFMSVLVSWLQRSPLWERQRTRLTIVHRLDRLRDLYGNPRNFHTPLKESLGQEIFKDLTGQAHFVRRYSERLLPSQRRSLLRDLERYEELFPWLSRPRDPAEDPDIDLDQAVRNLLDRDAPK